ncbi:6-phosphofructokinase [Sulfobacillus acidophilus TPY]|uniref:ATP-dependent 6-phosphofructokinase n=1 Tax=Sulfobacillus acidophilus (strain ATCC 700253 / DSM 10332 / NAL) TaxID=679936 RepID=G8TTN4_SULAD|nr:6-phosphofructokinase [Sulfobacillus acidophilus TPY]AEW06793.1 6-phosphofructokinase [Sulfobacillus acidophilus DSM 10332]
MRYGVLTSGGDAPGMNAAIRSVVRSGLAKGHEVFGVERGYEGLVKGWGHMLDRSSVADILMAGGTMLHTARFPGFRDEAVRRQAMEQIGAWHLDGLIVIGGNGSLAGAGALSAAGIPVVGIPASIDNDIAGTDWSLGFDTAVNNVVQSVDKIRDTASAHERVFVVEVMGNRTGILAAVAGLAAGAEAVIIPERPVDLNELADRLTETQRRGKKHSFIIVAEGADHADRVARGIQERTQFDVRWVVLGHTQRGGPASATDRILGALYGNKAVDALDAGQYGVMIGQVQGNLTLTPLATVLAESPRVPMDWVDLAELLAR